MVGTLALCPPYEAGGLAQLNSQQVDAWKFVESDFDHLRIHGLHEGKEVFALLLAYSQGQSWNTNLPHQITIQ